MWPFPPTIHMPRNKRPLNWEDRLVRDWIVNNRGVLSEIAIELHCSPQFVQAVAYGRSTALPGHPVELSLRRKGWPGTGRKNAKV